MDRTTLPPAIVLGVDSPIGLTVIRELGRHGVPVTGIGRSTDSIGKASRFARGFFVRPIGVPMEDWLPTIIAKTSAKALLAISEPDLLELSALPKTIDTCRILSPRRRQLDIVLDKTKTLELAAKLGISTPVSWQPATGEDFASRARGLSYPVAIKWPNPPAVIPELNEAGIGFEKAAYARTPQELLTILSRYDPVRQYPLVQTWCAGYGFGQMLFMADGKARLRFQHRRIHEWPVSGGVSTLCASVPLSLHGPQMAQSERLLAAIGWEGPAMVEYRYDPSADRYWLMEINGRFWGSLPLASHCRAEFAWQQYIFGVLGAEMSNAGELRIRRARFMIPETRRILNIFAHAPASRNVPAQPPSRARSMVEYLVEFVNPYTRYYVFSLVDPLPCLVDLLNVMRKIWRLRKRRAWQ